MLHTLAIDGERFTVRDEGRGPPVLLVHGFPFDHAMWAAQIEDLAPAFRVLAPDLRGFGGSTVSDGTVTMDRMADDIELILRELDLREPPVFVGFSMGGYVGWSLLARRGRALRGLVLVDTRAVADAPAAAAARLALAERVLREGPAPAADAMLPRLLDPGRAARDPALVERVRAQMLRQDPRGIAAALRGMARRPDARGRLARLDLPALALCGRHDAISTCEEMRTLASALPRCRLVEVSDAGHLTPIEAPGAVSSALLGFLATLS